MRDSRINNLSALAASIDHGLLDGLSDNDHGDVYYTEAEISSTTPGSPGASLIGVPVCGTPAYDDIQAWMNTTQASGVISGGGFTDNTDGSITVAAGTGITKATNSGIAEACFFNWAENAAVSLTDNSTNYIYVDYNVGSPAVGSETTKSADGRTKFYLGKVFREGTDLHIIEAGQNITELLKRAQSRHNAVDGEVVRASGYVVAETGERYLTTTNGVLYAGFTRITTTAIDTTGADTFESYYYDGDLGTPAWVEADASQLDNTYYNDVATGLAALTANKYGVHWIYGDADGHLMVVYGQANYNTILAAEAAQPPSSLPKHVSEFGFIAAKAIVQQGVATLYSLESAYDTAFTPAGSVDHSELSNLTWSTSGHTINTDVDLNSHDLQNVVDIGAAGDANLIQLAANLLTLNGIIKINANDAPCFHLARTGGAATYILDRTDGGVMRIIGGTNTVSLDYNNDAPNITGLVIRMGAGATVRGGAGVMTAVATFDTSGHFVPGTDDTYDLGGAAIKWRNLYIDGTAYIDNASITNADVSTFSSNLEPISDNNYNLGATNAWANLFLKGNIKDAAYSATVEQTLTSSINFVIDGGGSAIATGVKGFIVIDFPCKIVSCTLLADQSGAIKVDIWKDTYANYPPTDADTITGANEPEIAASGVKDQDSTLTDWTKTIAAGDVLGFNVDSCATITRCTVSLKVIKDNT